jgi:DNA mismatch repair protein MutS
VARIAGIPNEVILRAQEILINMEKGEFDEAGMPKIARSKKGTVRNKKQLSLFMDDEDIVLQELRDIDMLNLTPLDALNRIGHWKNKLNHS